MVIRFRKPSKQRALPLFDRLDLLRIAPRPPRLSTRQIEHRRRMLRHLTVVRAAAQ